MEGKYTVEDYWNWPKNERIELIDGVIYVMSSPTALHQDVVMEIYVRLRDHIRKKGGTCHAFVSPIGVQLDCDEKTMVQPDVLLLCDRDKLKRRVIYGAPDFVAEVLSPSTRRKDLLIKSRKYQNAGVREYWMIDPEKQQVMVYDFENDCDVAIYGFTDKISMRIFDGELVIDMAEIEESSGFMRDLPEE